MPVVASVYITTYNTGKIIHRTLAALCAQLDETIEAIVVDDGSTDNTVEIVKTFPVRLIQSPHLGRTPARLRAFREAKGRIIINIDADVIIDPLCVKKIIQYFDCNPEVQAGSAALSFHSKSKNFFTEYKHRYMNIIFGHSWDRVSFLYGSLFALRTSILNKEFFDTMTHTWVSQADDTEMGQFFYRRNVHMVVFPDIYTTHLKEFSFRKLINNDFNIPRDFGRLFVKEDGLSQIKASHGYFAHTSPSQVSSIFFAYLTVASLLLLPWHYAGYALTLWIVFSARFLFLLSNKEGLFAIKATLFTFFDHLIMGAGIALGLAEGLFLLHTGKRKILHS